MKDQIIEFLKERETKHGETVDHGFFRFLINKESDRLSLRILDFEKMASWIDDFAIVNEIESEQQAVLRYQGVNETDCNFMKVVFISKSYEPYSPLAFMKREEPAFENDSGWYLGMTNESLSLENPDNIGKMSVYEASINDKRLLPFWLLPFNWWVELKTTAGTIHQP